LKKGQKEAIVCRERRSERIAMRNTRDFGMIGMGSIAILLFSVAPALAKDGRAPRPEAFKKLVDCRAIADNSARLACYDAQVAKLDEAESKKELVIVDTEEVKKARKGLFGLSLPDLGGLFGAKEEGEDDSQGLSEISSTVKTIATNKAGKWAFTIADGARWVQTDTTSIRTPKVGQPIRIRRAALGSYFANIGEARAIRVMRTN
jgi:hypothetical protein